MSSTENRPSSPPNRGRSDTDNDSTKGGDDPTRSSGRKSEDGCDSAVSTAVQADQGLDGTPPTPASRCDKNATEGEFAPDLPAATAGGDASLGTLALAPKWTVEHDTKPKKLSPVRDSEAPMVTGGCSEKGNGSGCIWSTSSGEFKGGESSTVSARAASPSTTPASIQCSLPPPLPSRSPLLLPPPPPPPPPPQQTPNVAGVAGSGSGGGIVGTTALRDLDGCLVWYTDDSAAEADIESMASVASVDSREVGLMIKLSAVRIKRLAAHFCFIHNYCR